MSDNIDLGLEQEMTIIEPMKGELTVMQNKVPHISFEQIVAMAGYIEQCGLYGIKTLAQTVSIMLIAQATGQNPVLAARDYHILTFIDKKTGKEGCMPTLKADVILGRFLEAGGIVEYIDYTDTKVTMKFTWKNISLPITWDLDRAQKAELVSHMYKKYPQQMLKARCISEGVKAVCPQVTMGIYSTEEAEAFLYDDITPPEPEAPILKKAIQLKPKPAEIIDSGIIDEDVPEPIIPAKEKEEAPTIKPITKQIAIENDSVSTRGIPNTKGATYSKDKFVKDCRQLILDVKANKIDKEKARCEYFVLAEFLAAIYEDVPAQVLQSIEANLY